MLRKLRTLYVPAVIWSIIGLVVCLPIRLYLGNVADWERVVRIPLLMQTTYEAMHFWYIRNLLVCFIIAPIFLFFARSWIGLVVAVMPSLFIAEESVLSQMHIPVTTFYFMLGVWLAQRDLFQRSIGHLSRNAQVLCLIAGFTCWLLFAFRVWPSTQMAYPMAILVPMSGIGIVWASYDLAVDMFGEKECPEYFGAMFFVYCIHLIVIDYLGGIRLFIGNSPWARMLGWIILSCTFFFDIWLANLVRIKLPRIYSVLAGWR